MRPARDLRIPRPDPRIAAAVLALCAAMVAPTGAWAQSAQRIVTSRSTDPLSICARAATESDLADRSVEACDRALADRKLPHRDRVTATINRGVLHLRRKEGEAALGDFDAAIAIDPRNPEAHLNRGGALMLLKKPALAVAAITTSLSYGVSQPHKAYYNRAAAREALGDVRGAYEDYSAALAIEPDWGLAEAELARFARTRREQLAAQIDAQAGSTAAPTAPKGTP